MAHPGSETAECVHLNEVTQEVLQGITAGSNAPRLVVRCENLPRVLASRSQMTRLFQTLLRMIVSHSTGGKELFLYILCEEDKQYRPASANDPRRYNIHFRTNALAGTEWRCGNEKSLQECTFIIARIGGDFAVSGTKNTGCIFSISLLGKL